MFRWELSLEKDPARLMAYDDFLRAQFGRGKTSRCPSWSGHPLNNSLAMIRPAQHVLLPPVEYVNLSFCGFTFWWLAILVVYVAACAYNAGYAKFYWGFDSTILSYTLESHGVGMSRENFTKIAYVHIGIATMHGVCAIFMIVGSLRQRTLAFSLQPSRIVISPSKQIHLGNGTGTSNNKEATAKPIIHLAQVRHVILGIYRSITDRHGALGVNGRHFHTILICRELLETALQTVQAVRMSKYLPHALLNRFYVILLVINCWSSVFVYTRWFWQDEARRRFAAIVCDCVLDIMSTMGVSVMIVMNYVNQYDIVLTGFGFDLLDDDEWMAQMLNEAQMVVVVSWSDMVTRFVFSLGLILTTTSMKDLLHCVPKNGNRVATRSGISSLALIRLSLLGGAKGTKDCTTPNSVLKQQSLYEGTSRNIRSRVLLHHALHVLLAVWGVVMLALHIHASTQPSLVECMPTVHPMAGATPSCFKLNFDCHNLRIIGAREEVQAALNKFDTNTTVKLQFLHCTALEVPDSFQRLHRLKEIRVYNSTIVEWGAESAITNAHHPDMSSLSVIRVNMKSGLLPVGFQSLDFPINLLQLYFCETNLQTLPDDLDFKWHFGSAIYLENSELTVVPSSLVRLQPYYLTLAGNPIAEFPPELFASGYLQNIVLGRTAVRELPQTVVQPIQGPAMVDITNTNISFFWSWIDSLVEDMLDIAPAITAGGSTYCSQRERIMSRLTDDFSDLFQPGYSTLLMNSSEANWDILRAAVDCSPVIWVTQFPLEEWDQMYGMTEKRG